jgi:hypothetical protein
VVAARTISTIQEVNTKSTQYVVMLFIKIIICSASRYVRTTMHQHTSTPAAAVAAD